jgi:quinol monooxygenase YgiN
MSEAMIVVDRSKVRPGKLEELKTAMKDLADFVATNESRPISYDVYFDEDGAHMTVLQVHPDSASMEQHMRIAGSAFPKLADLVELQSMDVFGVPSDVLLDLIGRKFDLLGAATLVVHQHHAGFARFEDR